MNEISKVNGLEFMVDGNSEPCAPNVTPANITHQTNNSCQQFFGPVSGCVFAMPGANVYQTSEIPKDYKPSLSSKKKSTLPGVTATKAKKARQTKKSAPRELMTFRSRGIHDQCLTLFYNQLITDGWIEARTKESDFKELFSGSRSEGVIYWAGKYGKGTLVFLFRYMEMEGLIEYDAAFTLPNILMGHFVDTKGQALTNLDNGDPANDKAGKEIEDYMKILKYNPARAIRKKRRDDDDNFGGPQYGDAYDSFDHQDLHLHNKHGY